MSSLIKAIERSNNERAVQQDEISIPAKQASGEVVQDGLANRYKVALGIVVLVSIALVVYRFYGSPAMPVSAANDFNLPVVANSSAGASLPPLLSTASSEQLVSLPNIAYQAHVVFDDVSKNFVVINGERLAAGDMLGDWRVDAVYARQLILEHNNLLMRLPANTNFNHRATDQ